jgi:acyl phosphate:glycerol-3-phosphate acyltransferase
MWLILLCVLAYLAGSIPTSIIAGKVTRGIDIREHGSKNPGATNTFRVLGWKIGVSVGVIDIFKGFAAVWFLPGLMPATASVSPEYAGIATGATAVMGHVWTVFAGFRGGKGVGTAFGVFLALAPLPSVAVLVVWLAVTFSSGYVSLGSIVAAVMLPVSVVIEGRMRGGLSLPLTLIASVLALLVIVRHRANIGRLMRGEENRFGKRKRETV